MQKFFKFPPDYKPKYMDLCFCSSLTAGLLHYMHFSTCLNPLFGTDDGALEMDGTAGSLVVSKKVGEK
jgi:hypothetical protein